MKIKTLALTLSLMLFSSVSQGGPIDWVKHHKRSVLVLTAIAGASIVQAKGSSYCESGSPEVCNLGYGAKHERTFNLLSIGFSGLMFGAAEACWKDQPGWKFCYGLAYGIPVAQTSFGIHDFLSYKPEPKNESSIRTATPFNK